jgi:hypothetical protein
MALAVAERVAVAGVLTLVAYCRGPPPRCPWLALCASRDAVYRPEWAGASLAHAQLCEVDDDHYLHGSDDRVMRFVAAGLKQLQE